ncbi:MAG: NAD-dependent epimerase/dehydratase family protein [Armatimonadota bacterium]|jgi:nucleoside-diphosphate-sugar epimerase
MSGRSLNILIIGGSGFVSGTLARVARDAGNRVWTITRGEKPIPEGVHSLIADRKDHAAFAAAIEGAGAHWDLAVDCIGYQPEDARQDVEVLSPRVSHLVFISTDFVFDPRKRAFPQPCSNPHFLTGEGYGPGKRACEEVLLASDTQMRWTVLRPCHIYGPGSQLGCLPEHGRDAKLIERMRAGEPLRLVGGGHFLQQPIFARDLAELALSARWSELAHRGIYCAAGPDIIESVRYYEIIADILEVKLRVEEVPVAETRERHPEWASFLCHRIYDLTPLRLAGLKVPNTPIGEGLTEHVVSLI